MAEQKKPEVVFHFFKDIPDSTLREWEGFTESKLFKFMADYFDRDIARISKAIMAPVKNFPNIETVRWAEGEVKGTSKFRAFFEAVRNERRKRLDRAVTEQPEHSNE